LSQRRAERVAIFHPEFREDLRYWVETDRNTALRVLQLVEAALGDPCIGIGKPEALRHALAGAWSRRITKEHRLIYRVSESRVDFLQARYHY
jgi:toxin YoeB